MSKKLVAHAAGCERVLPPQTNTLAKVPHGFPREACNLAVWWQRGAIRYRTKTGKDLVTTNQRPFNGGCWRVNSRSFMEKSHVGVHAVGENHRGTSHQDYANLGGAHCAVGVATHLAMTGRGIRSGQYIVLLHIHTHKMADE